MTKIICLCLLKPWKSVWLTVLQDLKKRGVEDVLFACVDGLKGFLEAIQTAFPQTLVQLCVVHQIRYVLSRTADAADLR